MIIATLLSVKSIILYLLRHVGDYFINFSEISIFFWKNHQIFENKCSIDLKRQSKNSVLCIDTNSFF